MREAYAKGLRRSRAARARNGNHRYGMEHRTTDQQRLHFDGASAVAEALVAEATGGKWISDGVVPDPVDAGDVEGGIAVRWTARVNGCLIVHEEDPDHLVQVLVVGEPPRITIVGKMLTAQAKQPQWWRTNVPYPAFFVPQRELESL